MKMIPKMKMTTYCTLLKKLQKQRQPKIEKDLKMSQPQKIDITREITLQNQI